MAIKQGPQEGSQEQAQEGAQEQAQEPGLTFHNSAIC